jgi:hypothetical protein
MDRQLVAGQEGVDHRLPVAVKGAVKLPAHGVLRG